jgi:hypothetical protein
VEVCKQFCSLDRAFSELKWIKTNKMHCRVNNIFKILMPLPHVSAPFMRHPQGAHSSWWNMFTLTSWVLKLK